MGTEGRAPAHRTNRNYCKSSCCRNKGSCLALIPPRWVKLLLIGLLARESLPHHRIFSTRGIFVRFRISSLGSCRTLHNARATTRGVKTWPTPAISTSECSYLVLLLPRTSIWVWLVVNVRAPAEAVTQITGGMLDVSGSKGTAKFAATASDRC